MKSVFKSFVLLLSCIFIFGLYSCTSASHKVLTSGASYRYTDEGVAATYVFYANNTYEYSQEAYDFSGEEVTSVKVSCHGTYSCTDSTLTLKENSAVSSYNGNEYLSEYADKACGVPYTYSYKDDVLTLSLNGESYDFTLVE